MLPFTAETRGGDAGAAANARVLRDNQWVATGSRATRGRTRARCLIQGDCATGLAKPFSSVPQVRWLI